MKINKAKEVCIKDEINKILLEQIKEICRNIDCTNNDNVVSYLSKIIDLCDKVIIK